MSLTEQNNHNSSSDEEPFSDNTLDEHLDEKDLQAKKEDIEKDERVKQLQSQYGLTEIPDSTPEILPSDAELTQDLPDDIAYIDLIKYKIKDLESLNLSRFTSLESIVLRDNLLESLNGLKVLQGKEKLEELDVYDNRITHISKHVNEFPNLNMLDLSFNNIKTIKHLENLTKIENLYFVQNRVHEIKGLKQMTKLENLELGGNKISYISEELLELPSLEQLWLGKNRITRLENLNNLSNLRVLSIQSNGISKLENLEGLVNLEELYLSHNNLTELEGLDNLKNLNTLDITSNKISKLSNLSHLTKLTDLWCSYNLLSSFENISEQLGKLPELETVYFEGNPLQLNGPAVYRRKVKLALGPSLKKIDAMYITN
ncbi:hypothetical protein CANARDRAFT_203385 [[Candida] arabinofermentans NRRL YB-2248]|uniref:Protein phosphatase 1 regulatory subunit 7 n=1 Tax=[Candida] arabinofermentans NRRL YB-2248 TaxID=983967 RepID=A0A1E4SUW7_9ASCO|nr:hypothetical protein CANARDRAFT_203385 [[Candida] arabinofermentans NRRL YB-2248]